MNTSNTMAPLFDAAQATFNQPDLSAEHVEIAAVGVVSLFEARLQHLFARGPFYQKLSEKLTAQGHPALGQALYHYYLAINVIKRGSGKSHRELLDAQDVPFVVNPVGMDPLIDARQPDFGSGLVLTLRKAFDALEG